MRAVLLFGCCILASVLTGAGNCAAAFPAQQPVTASWTGSVRDASGHAASHAEIILQAAGKRYTVSTAESGDFEFGTLAPGHYTLSIRFENRAFLFPGVLSVPIESPSRITLLVNGSLLLQSETQAQASGGETLSGNSVTAIPLNKRDFSQLLLLAAGTMTDTNGTTNFTQQFAVNGQRGVEAVFATDGSDTSDPELGGAILSNFNVDAVQEIQSSSGWMPADIGRGAAGFTNILTRAGSNSFHGSAFEFLRNS